MISSFPDFQYIRGTARFPACAFRHKACRRGDARPLLLTHPIRKKTLTRCRIERAREGPPYRAVPLSPFVKKRSCIKSLAYS